MASVTKVEYYVNADGSMALDTIKQGGTTAPEGSVKATMKLGIGSQEKTGVTKANLSKLEANDTATVNNEFSSKMTTLESSGVTGNLIGKQQRMLQEQLRIHRQPLRCLFRKITQVIS